MYEGLFFCGKSLADEETTKTVARLQKWADLGFCYEMSALAMAALIDLGLNPSLNYCVVLRNNCLALGHNHCFVQYQIDGRDCVADFAWTSHPHVMTKEKFAESVGEIITKQVYTYEELMDKQGEYIMRLAECITKPETSYIFKELSYFRPREGECGRPICTNILDKKPKYGKNTGKFFKPFFQDGNLVNKKRFFEFYNCPQPV